MKKFFLVLSALLLSGFCFALDYGFEGFEGEFFEREFSEPVGWPTELEEQPIAPVGGGNSLEVSLYSPINFDEDEWKDIFVFVVPSCDDAELVYAITYYHNGEFQHELFLTGLPSEPFDIVVHYTTIAGPRPFEQEYWKKTVMVKGVDGETFPKSFSFDERDAQELDLDLKEFFDDNGFVQYKVGLPHFCDGMPAVNHRVIDRPYDVNQTNSLNWSFAVDLENENLEHSFLYYSSAREEGYNLIYSPTQLFAQWWLRKPFNFVKPESLSEFETAYFNPFNPFMEVSDDEPCAFDFNLGRDSSLDSCVCCWTLEETAFSELPNPKTVLFYSGGLAQSTPIDNPWLWFNNYFSFNSFWRGYDEDTLLVVGGGKYVFFPRPEEVITPFKPPIRLFLNETYNMPDAFELRGSEVYGFLFDSFERDPNLWMWAVNQSIVVTKPDGTNVSRIPEGPLDYSGMWGLSYGSIVFLGGQPPLDIGLDVGIYQIDWRVIGSFEEDLCVNATLYYSGYDHYTIVSKMSGKLVDGECTPFESGAISVDSLKKQPGKSPANDYLVKGAPETEQCGLVCMVNKLFDDFLSLFR